MTLRRRHGGMLVLNISDISCTPGRNRPIPSQHRVQLFCEEPVNVLSTNRHIKSKDNVAQHDRVQPVTVRPQRLFNLLRHTIADIRMYVDRSLCQTPVDCQLEAPGTVYAVSPGSVNLRMPHRHSSFLAGGRGTQES